MGRSSVIAVLIGWGVLFASPVAGLGQNVLENGSFDLFEGGKFATWIISPKANDEGVSKIGTVSQVVVDSAEAGNAASFGFTGAGKYAVILMKRVALEPGHKYVLSLRAMALEGSVNVKATARLIGEKQVAGQKSEPRDVVLECKAGKDWKTWTLDLETAANEQFLMIHLIVKNDANTPATLLLDEVSVAPPPVRE